MVNLKLKKRLYCYVVVFLSSFALCGNIFAADDVNSEKVSATESERLSEAQEEPVKAPAFTLTSIDGKQVNLSDYSFRSFVVLNFWSSSSTASRAMNKRIAALEKKMVDWDYAFINVSLDENKATAQSAARQDGLAGIQVCEQKTLENSEIAKQYGVTTLPTVIVINPDGNILKTDLKYVEDLVETVNKSK